MVELHSLATRLIRGTYPPYPDGVPVAAPSPRARRELAAHAAEAAARYGLDLAIPAPRSTIAPGALAQFFDRWVRPDRAVVVVSGPIDVDAVERAIRTEFAGWRAEPTPPATVPTRAAPGRKPCPTSTSCAWPCRAASTRTRTSSTSPASSSTCTATPRSCAASASSTRPPCSATSPPGSN